MPRLTIPNCGSVRDSKRHLMRIYANKPSMFRPLAQREDPRQKVHSNRLRIISRENKDYPRRINVRVWTPFDDSQCAVREYNMFPLSLAVVWGPTKTTFWILTR